MIMKDTVKSMRDADTLARKAANTFSAVRDYAQMGGDLTGHAGSQGYAPTVSFLGLASDLQPA